MRYPAGQSQASSARQLQQGISSCQHVCIEKLHCFELLTHKFKMNRHPFISSRKCLPDNQIFLSVVKTSAFQ